MICLYVVVEGETEHGFVKHVLGPHLEDRGIWATPIIVMTKKERSGRKHRGGGDWTKWKADIRRLCDDSRAELRITSLFDLYGLPANFPELGVHSSITDTRKRCDLLEQAMAKAISDTRFIPYLQRHEFEALVLAGLPALESILVDDGDRAGLKRMENDMGNLEPEDVNDGKTTAPSKRLERFIPSYNPGNRTQGEGKPVYGLTVTKKTGLPALRAKCPRFNEWVTQLEALGATQP